LISHPSLLRDESTIQILHWVMNKIKVDSMKKKTRKMNLRIYNNETLGRWVILLYKTIVPAFIIFLSLSEMLVTIRYA
jgi:hypothetical protein